jgi:hypothetical protein
LSTEEQALFGQHDVVAGSVAGGKNSVVHYFFVAVGEKEHVHNGGDQHWHFWGGQKGHVRGMSCGFGESRFVVRTCRSFFKVEN